MSYLTASEFIDRYTEREARALTDRAKAGVVDTALLQRTLDEASAYVDSFVGRRYALPLVSASTGLAVVPEVLKRITGDVTRYQLTGTDVMETEAIRKRYEDANKLLAKIADGELSLGDARMAASAAAPVGGAASVRSAERSFGRDVLDRMY